jgi:LPXTG-motif cell wall-anchored protein
MNPTTIALGAAFIVVFALYLMRRKSRARKDD